MLLALPHRTCSWFNYQLLMVKYPSPANLPLVDGQMPMCWRLDFIFWWLNQYTNPYFADEISQIPDFGSWIMTSKSHENVFRPVVAAPHGPPMPQPVPENQGFLWPQAGPDGHTTRLRHQHGLAIVELEEVVGMDAPGNFGWDGWAKMVISLGRIMGYNVCILYIRIYIYNVCVSVYDYIYICLCR